MHEHVIENTLMYSFLPNGKKILLKLSTVFEFSV